MKWDVSEKILPLPIEKECVIHADDCIVWGAYWWDPGSNILKGHKLIIEFMKIKRISENNMIAEYLYKRQISIHKIFRAMAYLTKIAKAKFTIHNENNLFSGI
jgi:hypothetical protein